MEGNGWPAVPLSELYDFGSGLSKPRSEFGFGYGFLSFKDVFENYFVPEQLTQLVNSTEEERGACSIRRGDVFLTRTSETMDELGMSSVALKDYEGATFNGFTKRLRPRSSTQIVPEYAAYYFRSPKFRRDVTAMSTLSTRASLNNEMLSRLTIVLPPERIQQSIGSILKALDDKIELNGRMNATLETIVRALFQSWFVDFDPVRAKLAGRQPTGLDPATAALFPSEFEDSELGPIPQGWEVGSILRQVDLISGGTPKTDIAAYWRGDIDWASAKDVSQCGEAFLIATEKKITRAGLENSATKIIPQFATVIVARGATTGRLTMFGDATAMNQTCYALQSKVSAPFVLYCQARQFIESMVHAAHGSVFDTITTETFKRTNVLLPPVNVLTEFNKRVGPLFGLILSNLRQSLTLATIRDAQLPKLLSGELRIFNVCSAIK